MASRVTPAQITLTRHALGLPNKAMRSWRKHYCIGAGSPDHIDWLAMVEVGHATRRDGKTVPFGGDDLFHVMRAGAVLALEPGESLDGADFPMERA